MREFHVGDEVWCNRKGYYRITSYHVPCIVVKVASSTMKVSLSRDSLLTLFDVLPEYFELIPIETEWV